jgi:drug/metabolite transporter (DMT)-like permease
MDASTLALILGLTSALSLAAVNAVVKAGGDILMARTVLSVAAAILTAPAIVFVPLPTGSVWIALIFSLIAHGAYQFGLINALSRGDLSVVFPIMRGGAPILVAVAAAVFLSESLRAHEWAGLIIATLGVLGFVIKPGRLASGLHIPRSAFLFAGFTAFAIAAYSVLDARGVRLAGNPLTYIVWLFVLDGIQIGIAAALIRKRTFIRDAVAIWRYGVIAALGSMLSFGVLLYAMSLTEVARVSALRESAVVFAALFGWLFLKEGFGKRRLIFALITASGLAMMNISTFG